MSRPIPHTQAGAWPGEPPPGRFASLVRARSPEGCRVALLGLPDDLGVRLNGGRPGAVGGPAALRAALARYGTAEPAGWSWPAVFDAGDVIPATGNDPDALAETHRRITEATLAILDLGLLPIAIGGGHDLTYPFVRAVAPRIQNGPLGGVYFDAHLDVRETVGSGMPFRRLIEEFGVKPLVNIGFNPLVNSREHHDWFIARGGFFRPMPGGQWPEFGKPQFVSVDLDSIDASQAPGVSAPNPAGLLTHDVARALTAAGRCPAVRCLDLMELNPLFDPDGRTARCAAHLLLSFLHGFAERPGGGA
ncbi:MAG: arginase family protein [Phycisphaerales bacterium]